MRRPSGRLAATLLVSVAATLAIPTATAQAASSYRYWSFWQSNGSSWAYSNEGAGTLRPHDGDVEGWRFAISQGASSSSIAPRAAARFDDLCKGVPAKPGIRRVGLVVDSGTSADAPSNETPKPISRFCVTIADGATALAVLDAVRAVRTKDGFICAIDDYPRSECAAVIRDVAPAPASPPAGSVRSSPVTGSAGSASTAADVSRGSQAALPQPSATRSPRPGTDAPSKPSPSLIRSKSPATPAPTATVVDAAANAPDSGNPLPSLLVVTALALVGAGFVLARRRRS